MGTPDLPKKTHFSFIAGEISNLLKFFHNIAAIELEAGSIVNISDAELRRLVLSKAQAASLVQDNQDVFLEAVRSELTTQDVVALGYRKKQLAAFERLLVDRKYFDHAKIEKNLKGDEALWQAFFERNQWVFGYGLCYIYVTGFDDRKLEQVVEGYDLSNNGKRTDGLMKTRGLINAVCFVEIKTHETKLLEGSAYRAGCWAPSRELVGAVAQVQGTVAAAMRNINGMQRLKDRVGDPTGEDFYNFKPRAFVVVGSLSEFVTDTGVNEDKFRSFELYRNNISGIDIVTFDELYERSRFIVNATD